MSALFRTLNSALDRLVLITPLWVPALLLIPALYAIGWIKAQLLTLIGLPPEAVSLVGTLFSFVLFLLLMPRWIRLRWGLRRPWRALGIRGSNNHGHPLMLSMLFRGLIWAVLLLALVVIPLLVGSWGSWRGDWSLRMALDALLLLFGAGMAEELIFRGWLWGELDRMVGPLGGLLAQAAIFSLVHTRFNLGVMPMVGLLTGLFLLGLALAVRRHLDQGSLWGCIGLHGGLVSGWFVLEKGLLELSPDAPAWLSGPGGLNPNPLGGAVAITALTLLLWRQRMDLVKALKPAQ